MLFQCAKEKFANVFLTQKLKFKSKLIIPSHPPQITTMIYICCSRYLERNACTPSKTTTMIIQMHPANLKI